jgi:cytoskeletal protein CcmA (bactofilin family)
MAILKGKAEAEAHPAAGGLSIVAVGMTVRGDLESNGTVKVEGIVEGHVRARNQVLVAKNGAVQGDIDAREAVIGGTASGAIRALERVEIQSGAVVNGDITTRRISVAEGGTLNGLIRMGEPPSTQARPATPSTPGRVEQPRASQGAAGTQSAPRPPVLVSRPQVPPRAPTAGSGH